MNATDDIAAQLRKAVKRAGLSMYAVSKASGIRYSVIHRILTGERGGMTVDTAQAIAKTAGMKLELRPTKKGR